MDDILIRQIATDLNINRYRNESDKEYGNRLIYTALGVWARTLVLGRAYTDLSYETKNINTDYNNVDIMHMQYRLSQIANGMLRTIPHYNEWIGSNTIEKHASNLASQIIKNLIFCYELSQLDDIRRVTSSPIRNANFKNNELILGGQQWKIFNESVFCVGLGRWIKSRTAPQNYKEIFNLPNYIHNEYYDTLLDSAFWKEGKPEGKYKIFNTGTGLFYNKAWDSFNISKFPRGISLLKSIDVDGGYLLVNNNGEKILAARLDKWYYEEKEIYRIMYVLDKHNDTPAVFRAKVYDDYVLLHCHSKLPNSEMRILLMSSWPKRFYNDCYYRIIPKFIWEEVKTVLIDLGIEINCINI